MMSVVYTHRAASTVHMLMGNVLLAWHLSLCAGVVPKSHPQNFTHQPTALTIGIIWSADGQNMNKRKAKEEEKTRHTHIHTHKRF